MFKKLAALTAATLLFAAPALSQGFPSGNITAPPPPVPAGIKVEKVVVHSKAIEGNLEGDSADRAAMVVLPPSYGKDPKKHYPVVYYLHGFAIDGENFYNFMHVPEAVAHNAAAGREFIVVVPDTLTKLGGSMYGTSVTTGDFRSFVADDLVYYIDAHYRTIPTRAGRGLAGHSMGGYGTWTIGMTHPENFNAIYAQSACCVSPRRETVESAAKLAAIPIEQGVKADFGTRAALSSMVAWSPNPQNPPYFADFPIKDGQLDELVLAKWANNSPLAMVASHVPALKSFVAIGADVGTKDGLIADDTAIHEELERFGIRHDWATYEGTHVDHIAQRFDEVVLPFMAQHLAKAK
ncbi:MAG: esterase [Novosphingobium sp.]|nr:esterase [Novosphingobium sp.]MBO9602166.1 esterase [Novosphingobium sp.]